MTAVQKRVLIGAGVAGLYQVYRLREAGFEVKAYEARRASYVTPEKRSAEIIIIQDEAKAAELVAQWRRARYFPKFGEDMHAAVNRECRAVRTSVSIFDASTLGKIEVVGPDAAEFLNRMYTNPWKALEPGRCRYGLLLKEDGFITDDGVSARLAPDRFHLTTTTGGAARVLNMMEDYLQTEWPDLNVWLTSTTEQYAVIALQGPKARDVIAPFVEGIDLAPEAFPHMAVREGTICGVPNTSSVYVLRHRARRSGLVRSIRHMSASGVSVQHVRQAGGDASRRRQLDVLVRPVRVAVRAEHAGDHELRAREFFAEHAHERDAAAGPHVHRVLAEERARGALHRLLEPRGERRGVPARHRRFDGEQRHWRDRRRCLRRQRRVGHRCGRGSVRWWRTQARHGEEDGA